MGSMEKRSGMIPPDDIFEAYLKADENKRAIASDILGEGAVGMSAVLSDDGGVGVSFYASGDGALKLLVSIIVVMKERYGSLWLTQLWRNIGTMLPH